jgi:hypothetical protein
MALDQMAFNRKFESDPTPEEIAQRAAEIRESWTAAEERRRRETPIPTWIVPLAGKRRLSRTCRIAESE